MNKFLNLSILEGRLTKDPELNYTKGGQSLCKFDIAINESIKDGNEYRETVDFFCVTTWSKLAEACAQYLKKGAKVRVKGRLRQNSWVNNDGKKRTEVVVDAASVDFLSAIKKDEAEKVS